VEAQARETSTNKVASARYMGISWGEFLDELRKLLLAGGLDSSRLLDQQSIFPGE
jgi:hypothetical protein